MLYFPSTNIKVSDIYKLQLGIFMYRYFNRYLSDTLVRQIYVIYLHIIQHFVVFIISITDPKFGNTLMSHDLFIRLIYQTYLQTYLSLSSFEVDNLLLNVHLTNILTTLSV